MKLIEWCQAAIKYIINPHFSSYRHNLYCHHTQTQANPKASSQEGTGVRGAIERPRSQGLHPGVRCVFVPTARSGPDLPGMTLQLAVCPALRAEWGSSSSSLYSASVTFSPSPKPPSCCPPPRTLTMYFFCNNACPVLQASALATTHMTTVSKCIERSVNQDTLRFQKVSPIVLLVTSTRSNNHNKENLFYCSRTYPCPSLSAASLPADRRRSSFCKQTAPSSDCQ